MEAGVYVHTAFPIIGAHGYFGPNNAVGRWRALLQEADLEVLEMGHVPGTLYVLARKASDSSNAVSLRSQSNAESTDARAALE